MTNLCMKWIVTNHSPEPALCNEEAAGYFLIQGERYYFCDGHETSIRRLLATKRKPHTLPPTHPRESIGG